MNLVNSTLAGNTATTSGGGLSQHPNYGTSTAANTIFAGNTAAAAPDMDGTVTATNSLFGNSGGADHHRQRQPAQRQPAARGPGQQRRADADDGHPRNQPAFNAGSNASAAGLTTDRRSGFGRIALGTVDIGAFEIQQTATVYVDDDWAGTAVGSNPANDPITSAPLVFGFNAFADIQSGIDAVAAGGTLVIFGGAYSAAVDFNKRSRRSRSTPTRPRRPRPW